MLRHQHSHSHTGKQLMLVKVTSCTVTSRDGFARFHSGNELSDVKHVSLS